MLVCWRQGDPFWLRLVSDPRLLDIAEQYVGSDIALFQSHYICKEPRDGQVVLWHQVSVLLCYVHVGTCTCICTASTTMHSEQPQLVGAAKWVSGWLAR